MDLERDRKLIRETVKEMFLALGVDIEKEGEAKEVQQDFAFLRSFRTTAHAVRVAAITALVTAAMTGFAATVWHVVTSAHAG